MYRPLETKSPVAVAEEVQSACKAMFPGSDLSIALVKNLFDWTAACFEGKYANYQAVDLKYHDFEHTLQGTLCLIRLLHGRHRVGAQPVLTERMFQLGLAAILLHDTGYLKTHDDTTGTGAKYTLIHVARSADFAEKLLGEKDFSDEEIAAVQHMISCTGVDANPQCIPFASELEKTVGLALATADLLGQMAAADYVDKLPVLYGEFAEAALHNPDKTAFITSFSSAQDLMANTPSFWEGYVRKKLDTDLGGLYRFLNEPYPDGPNDYLGRIEANIAQLKSRLREPEAPVDLNTVAHLKGANWGHSGEHPISPGV